MTPRCVCARACTRRRREFCHRLFVPVLRLIRIIIIAAVAREYFKELLLFISHKFLHRTQHTHTHTHELCWWFRIIELKINGQSSFQFTLFAQFIFAFFVDSFNLFVERHVVRCTHSINYIPFHLKNKLRIRLCNVGVKKNSKCSIKWHARILIGWWRAVRRVEVTKSVSPYFSFLFFFVAAENTAHSS